MPWTADDAVKHNSKAKTSHLKKVWAAAANAALRTYKDEGVAVRVGNSAVNDAIRRGHGKA